MHWSCILQWPTNMMSLTHSVTGRNQFNSQRPDEVRWFALMNYVITGSDNGWLPVCHQAISKPLLVYYYFDLWEQILSVSLIKMQQFAYTKRWSWKYCLQHCNHFISTSDLNVLIAISSRKCARTILSHHYLTVPPHTEVSYFRMSINRAEKLLQNSGYGHRFNMIKWLLNNNWRHPILRKLFLGDQLAYQHGEWGTDIECRAVIL